MNRIIIFKAVDITLQVLSLLLPVGTHYFFTGDKSILLLSIGGVQLTSCITTPFVLAKINRSPYRKWYNGILAVFGLLYLLLLANSFLGIIGGWAILDIVYFFFAYICPIVAALYFGITLQELVIASHIVKDNDRIK